METIRNFRNLTVFIAAVYCWGIAGSVELERLGFTEGVHRMLNAALVCAAVLLVEFLLKTAKVFLIRYARRRARAERYRAIKRNAHAYAVR